MFLSVGFAATRGQVEVGGLFPAEVMSRAVLLQEPMMASVPCAATVGRVDIHGFYCLWKLR